MSQTSVNKEMKEAVSDVKKSKIRLFWESRQGTKGKIVNMRAVLK